MTKYLLLAGVATALAIVPTAAFAENGGYTDTSLSFSNSVSLSIDNYFSTSADTYLDGSITVSGNITPDSAAFADTDLKQITSYNSVSFWDPSQFPETGAYADEDAGQPGHVTNTASAASVTASGNTGVNVASGQYNEQENSANLSVSGDNRTTAMGGSATANAVGYQSLSSTSYGTPDGSQPGGNNTEIYNYWDSNSATGGAVGSNGNVGENVAAGAFNQQQNMLTIAVANNSILSQSSAALWQTASCNAIGVQNEANSATSGAITGSGNIGVNIAAGVGNQQANALTAAVSNSTSTAGTGGTGGPAI